MLPKPCYWINYGDDASQGCVLRWNYGTVASIRLIGDTYEATVMWQGRQFWHRTRSLRFARYCVERWVSAQPGMPGMPRRGR